MRLWRLVGLILLTCVALTGCFYSLDGSLVGKQRDGAFDAFLDAGTSEQGPPPDAGLDLPSGVDLDMSSGADLATPD